MALDIGRHRRPADQKAGVMLGAVEHRGRQVGRGALQRHEARRAVDDAEGGVGGAEIDAAGTAGSSRRGVGFHRSFKGETAALRRRGTAPGSAGVAMAGVIRNPASRAGVSHSGRRKSPFRTRAFGETGFGDHGVIADKLHHRLRGRRGGGGAGGSRPTRAGLRDMSRGEPRLARPGERRASTSNRFRGAARASVQGRVSRQDVKVGRQGDLQGPHPPRLAGNGNGETGVRGCVRAGMHGLRPSDRPGHAGPALFGKATSAGSSRRPNPARCARGR